jgi:type IV secretory pathway VirB10-like protein
MSSQTSRKIIVASAMAAVVGIGVVTFALRSHPVTSVARPPHPTTPVTQIPAANLRAAEIPAVPPPVAQIPDLPAAVAQVPDAPAAVAHHDRAGTSSTDTATPSAAERKVARKQHLAKADTSAVATNGTAARNGSAADTTEKPATETVANSVDRVKSADELTTTPASSGSPADDQKVGTSTEFADTDSQTTPK